MKDFDDVVIAIMSDGFLEHCFTWRPGKLEFDREAFTEFFKEYANEIVAVELKHYHQISIDIKDLDDDLDFAIRRVLEDYMTHEEYSEWENEIKAGEPHESKDTTDS